MLNNNQHFGLVLNKGELQHLKKVCEEFGIPVTYPTLFKGHHHHYLWGFDKNGIGLVGTQVMKSYEAHDVIIFHGVSEMEEYLKTHWE